MNYFHILAWGEKQSEQQCRIEAQSEIASWGNLIPKLLVNNEDIHRKEKSYIRRK